MSHVGSYGQKFIKRATKQANGFVELLILI